MHCYSWCGENGSFSAQCTFYLSHSTQVATVFRNNTVMLLMGVCHLY